MQNDFRAERARIDDLDERIIALLRRRLALSTTVQRRRLAAGGERVAAERELEVVGRYRAAFGTPGEPLAKSLLRLCRGEDAEVSTS